MFNRAVGIFRRYLHGRDLCEIKPAFVRLASLLRMMGSHYPLPHDSILASERLMSLHLTVPASSDHKTALPECGQPEPDERTRTPGRGSSNRSVAAYRPNCRCGKCPELRGGASWRFC